MIRKLKQRLIHHQPIRFRSAQPQAGVLVALTDDPYDPEVILTRRSSRLSTHSGEVAFPGGKYDDTDLDVEFTALREAHEEIGLNPDHVQVVGRLGQLMSKHNLQVTPYVAVVPKQLDLVPNPGELDAVFRVPVSFLLEPSHYQMHQIHYKGMMRDVPAWRYDQYLIWGLTAHILADLMNIAFDANIPLTSRPEHKSRI